MFSSSAVLFSYCYLLNIIYSIYRTGVIKRLRMRSSEVFHNSSVGVWTFSWWRLLLFKVECGSDSSDWSVCSVTSAALTFLILPSKQPPFMFFPLIPPEAILKSCVLIISVRGVQTVQAKPRWCHSLVSQESTWTSQKKNSSYMNQESPEDFQAWLTPDLSTLRSFSASCVACTRKHQTFPAVLCQWWEEIWLLFLRVLCRTKHIPMTLCQEVWICSIRL